MIKKAKWNELELGQTYYIEIYRNHKTQYIPVKIIDLNDKKVTYEYEDHWKEFQNKSLFSEIGLYKDDKQLILDI